jgi:YD repeat-containing protein
VDALLPSHPLCYTLGDLTTITDPLNNITTRFTDPGGRHRTRYEWDPLNQLTKVIDPLKGRHPAHL